MVYLELSKIWLFGIRCLECVTYDLSILNH